VIGKPRYAATWVRSSAARIPDLLVKGQNLKGWFSGQPVKKAVHLAASSSLVPIALLADAPPAALAAEPGPGDAVAAEIFLPPIGKNKRGGSRSRLFHQVHTVLLLAGIHPAVVEFCHGAGLADEAVARRVVLHGVTVSCVRTTRVPPTLVVRTAGVIARPTIVRCGSDSGSRADHGGTCETSAVHSPPVLSPRNTRNAHGCQRATDPCLGALD